MAGNTVTATKGAAPKLPPAPFNITSQAWAAALLQYLKVPVTQVNIDNIDRWIEVESAGNQAGFLRDNNPLNLNTYKTPHSDSLPNGNIVYEFGVYIQKFNSPQAGIEATANQIKQSPSLLKVLQHSGSAALFGGALSTSAWSSGSYANATKFPTITPAHVTASGASETGASGDVLHFFNDALGGGDPFFGSGGNTQTPASDLSIVGGTGKTIVSGVTSVGGLIGDITNPQNLKNVGIFLAGAALVVTGIVIFLAQTKTAKGVAGVAEKVA